MGKLPLHEDLVQEMQREEQQLQQQQQSMAVLEGGKKSQMFVEPYDWRYCRRLAARNNVIGIPASPFFSRSDYSDHYGIAHLARFAFCKRDETLLEASRRLSGHTLI